MRLRSIPGSKSSGPAAADARAEASPLEDHELISALLAGDPGAGPELYDRLVRVVEWTILRVTGRRLADHEDLVQSAFEQIVISLYRQRFARACALTSWASSISCHVALNALRSQQRSRRWLLPEQALPELERAASGSDVEGEVGARRELERVRSHLARMKPERASAVILHDVNGLELKELAAVMGVSVAAAQSRLSRGRRELGERLAEDELSRRSET
jgi:RNA polymerase sigma-70 factor (ECF subfamily)